MEKVLIRPYDYDDSQEALLSAERTENLSDLTCTRLTQPHAFDVAALSAIINCSDVARIYCSDITAFYCSEESGIEENFLTPTQP